MKAFGFSGVTLLCSLAARAVAVCSGIGPSGKCTASTFQFKGVLPDTATIESISLVKGGPGYDGCYGEGASDLGYPNYAYNLPQLCAVTVNVSTYRFGLFLPMTNWQGRFLAVGNYAFQGGINWVDMTPGPHYGMATMSTDTGHISSPAADTAMDWAKNNPRAQADWGYVAMNGSITYAKLLTEQFYRALGGGSTVLNRSYYSGCSTGGRQGLKQIQINPQSIDGALIGAPAWQTDHLMPWITKIASYNLPESDPKVLGPAQWTLLSQIAAATCDGLDHVTDGIISIDNCRLIAANFTAYTCGNPGTDPSNCLSPAQVTTAQAMYSDYYLGDDSSGNGTLVYHGPNPGSEADWAAYLTAGLPSGFDQAWAANFLGDAGDRDADSVFAKSVAQDPGGATADAFDIRAFRDNGRGGGGKLILYHGLADGVLPTRGSLLYFNRTAQVTGDGTDAAAAMASWFRYFQIPGMRHCWGSDVGAPWMIGGAGQPASIYAMDQTGYSVPGRLRDPRYDALQALIEWVENQRPVDSLVATSWRPNSGAVWRERPLCPWPRTAVLKAPGLDETVADNWQCSS